MSTLLIGNCQVLRTLIQLLIGNRDPRQLNRYLLHIYSQDIAYHYYTKLDFLRENLHLTFQFLTPRGISNELSNLASIDLLYQNPSRIERLFHQDDQRHL